MDATTSWHFSTLTFVTVSKVEYKFIPLPIIITTSILVLSLVKDLWHFTETLLVYLLIGQRISSLLKLHGLLFPLKCITERTFSMLTSL